MLNPLRGMAAPCELGEIAERWRSEGVVEDLTRETVEGEVELPHYSSRSCTPSVCRRSRTVRYACDISSAARR